MRSAADADRVRRLARELGSAVAPGTKMYLTGGATAVLEGWRESTVDIDVNVELIAVGVPPPLPAWPERSRFRFREGNLEVFDFDPYSQALSKLQRGFELDLADVRSMVESGQVKPRKLRELYADIEGELYRFPAVDPASLQAAVESLDNERPEQDRTKRRGWDSNPRAPCDANSFETARLLTNSSLESQIQRVIAAKGTF